MKMLVYKAALVLSIFTTHTTINLEPERGRKKTSVVIHRISNLGAMEMMNSHSLQDYVS